MVFLRSTRALDTGGVQAHVACRRRCCGVGGVKEPLACRCLGVQAILRILAQTEHVAIARIVKNPSIREVGLACNHKCGRLVGARVRPIAPQVHSGDLAVRSEVDLHVRACLLSIVAKDAIAVCACIVAIGCNGQSARSVRIRHRSCRVAIDPSSRRHLTQGKVHDLVRRNELEITRIEFVICGLLGSSVTLKRRLCLGQQVVHIGICPGCVAHQVLLRFDGRNQLRQRRCRHLVVGKGMIVDSKRSLLRTVTSGNRIDVHDMVGILRTQVGTAGKLTVNIDLKHAIVLANAGNRYVATRNRHIGGSGRTVNDEVRLAVLVDTESPLITLREKHRRGRRVGNARGNSEAVLALNAVFGIRKLTAGRSLRRGDDAILTIGARDTSLEAVTRSILALGSRNLNLAAALHGINKLDVKCAHISRCLNALAFDLLTVNSNSELGTGHVLACLNTKALCTLDIHRVELRSLSVALLAQVPNLGLARFERHGNRIALGIAILRRAECASVRSVGFHD